MNDEQRREWVLERLKHALQALALPTSEQLSLLPDFVVKTDELVLDFDHWRLCAVGSKQLDAAQLQALARIGHHISTAKSGSRVWHERSLRLDPFWGELRTLGKQALEAFGWPVEAPPSYAHEYVPGKRRDE
jgi:hypothetical protein